MITISPEHAAERAAAALAATLTKLNSGALGASVRLFATARPANGAAPGADPLAAWTLLKPAGVIDEGVLTLDQPEDALIMVTGVALWARIFVDSAIVLDCDVSDMEGTAMIRLASTQLYAGGLVRLTSGVLI
jgi:hypothetical protein